MGMEYVDIHSHVLYGLDDGAATLEESRKMLELARAAGTSAIVATPHANAKYRYDPALVDQRIAELDGHSGIAIHRGCDFHLQFDTIRDAIEHPRKYTINRTAYLLVELPDSTIFGNTDHILQRLLDAGMIPIITHPERNAVLQTRPDDIARWIQIGCYVQVTAASYTGLFGRRSRACADDLLTRGLTHFVASDAHDCERRTPNLRKAYVRLADKWGEERIRPLFVDNPQAVLADEAVEFEPPPVTRPRRWYQFWR